MHATTVKRFDSVAHQYRPEVLSSVQRLSVATRNTEWSSTYM